MGRGWVTRSLISYGPPPYSSNTQKQSRDIAKYLSKVIKVCCINRTKLNK